ncbi:MAG: PadR family transcriptional regulator [Actinobacteria bacterium]|nr:MAG: PadR family transcriptional regulator [Actinomycetota bacterium]
MAIKLKPPAYLMLGMLRLGASSGYAIKKAADVSTRFFWPTSLAQVYPELARLEREGLVTRRDDAHGARARSAYQITERGEAALLAWLRSTHEAPLQFRDEGVLRLFLADAIPYADQLALVRRLRSRAHAATVHMRSEIVPLADALAEGGTRYPAVVARLGADTYAYAERWLGRLEAELGGERLND